MKFTCSKIFGIWGNKDEAYKKKRHSCIFALAAFVLFTVFGGEAKGQSGAIKPILPNDIQISPINDAWYSGDVAFDGNNYLVVWSGGSRIRGQFMDRTGNLVRERFEFPAYPAWDLPAWGPNVAFNGTNYLVIWNGNFSSSGQLITPQGGFGSQFAIPGNGDVASDGVEFLVVFGWKGGIYGQRVTSSGALVGDKFRISPADNKLRGGPVVAFDGTNYLVVWIEDPFVNAYVRDIYGARVTTSGIVLDPSGIAISTAPGIQSSWMPLGISFGDTSYLVVWEDQRNSSAGHIYGARVSMAGELLDGPSETGGIAISTKNVYCNPHGSRVAFDGTSWLVAWAGCRCAVARVSTSGTVLDPDGIPVSYGAWWPNIAFDGSNYLVTWLKDGTTVYGQLVSTISATNTAPTANAGADQTVNEGALVTVDGSGSSDPEGAPLTYHWAQLSGPPVTLNLTDPVHPSFVAPTVPAGGASLTFQLTVSDGTLTSDPDAVNITVKNVNHPPTANAGADQTKDEGSLVTLNGLASSDPDGDPLVYSWTQLSGPVATLSDPSSATPSFTAPLVNAGGATLVFQLTVSDGLGGSATDTVAITVFNINDPPACRLAQASPALLWPPNHKLVPVGITGVSDPDNDPVTITVTSVTQDEATNGLGDGDASPDAVIQGNRVLLRAERGGGGNGRVYEVTFSATDASGGSCTGSVTVCVPHDRATSCVNDGQWYNSLQP